MNEQAIILWIERVFSNLLHIQGNSASVNFFMQSKNKYLLLPAQNNNDK